MKFLVGAQLPRLLTDRLCNQLSEVDMETFIPRTIDDDTIRRIRNRIVEACDPEAILLFGSVARTEHRDGSDLDLLVIVDLPPGKSNREQMGELSDLFPGRLVPMDLLVLTPKQYREGRHLLGHIARTASREGVRIYG